MIKFRTMSADAEMRMKDIEHLNEKIYPRYVINHYKHRVSANGGSSLSAAAGFFRAGPH